MRIRAAKVADIQFILLLSEQINRQHHQGAPHVFSPPEQAEDGAEAYWLGLMLEPDGHFLVAEENDQIVAFLVGKITQNSGVSFIQDHKVARVNTIVVGEDAQGYGLGKKLMRAFNQWAQANGATELRLEVMEFNQDAQRFYQSLGMVTQSRIMSMPLEDV
ncbi:GNAT family N-acetyltransferase [Vibrio sp. D404a]|uniref:GNAT family N-acetyltransferase n=1 Tax=unclassified Vibrio TaxID=2614977 RepID=UPI002554E912|nr:MULTISPECIES: GNAT family N-acetyltransferase [unclassified Vibrio]MDK9736970.1 GNAT family N-acetyltransferase [Vibrio sp. D404a]MDK9798117.1 GNAT family N-acetyltransferase [Vibrio sp. D449a]